MPAPRGASADERLTYTGWQVGDGGCWLWLGGKFTTGYGRLTFQRRSVYAHRLAYETWVGPIPEGMFVCHRCDIKPCINPEHLFLGTPADNMADKVAKGRLVASPGVLNGQAKLTWEQVINIRRRYEMRNVSQQALADEFSVTQTMIGNIVRGEAWKEG